MSEIIAQYTPDASCSTRPPTSTCRSWRTRTRGRRSRTTCSARTRSPRPRPRTASSASCSSRPTRRSTRPTSWARPSDSPSRCARRCRRASRMSLVAVRFGNVLGSTGSVIPKFREQIARGGPITVTHPDIIRYFMSIPEAAQLVLQAGAHGQRRRGLPARHGQAGAHRRSRARHDPALRHVAKTRSQITFTGLRPGEKLFEELVGRGRGVGADAASEAAHRAHGAAGTGGSLEQLMPWVRATRTLSDADTRAALARWVPGYQPAPQRSAGGEPRATARRARDRLRRRPRSAAGHSGRDRTRARAQRARAAPAWLRSRCWASRFPISIALDSILTRAARAGAG